MKNQIKFLVMDVDGTLTDGKIYIGNDGELMKAFDVKDGCGIKDILPQIGIIPVIITARRSAILERRCEELNIEFLYQGVRNKFQKLSEILEEQADILGENFCFANVAYIGDDILDLQCMQPIKSAGGIVGCPSDAAKEVVSIADYVSDKFGGNGAVREFINFLLEKKY